MMRQNSLLVQAASCLKISDDGHPVMLNDCEHGIQVPVHRIARTTCLKILPGTTNPLKPSYEPCFWSFAFSLAMWPA